MFLLDLDLHRGDETDAVARPVAPPRDAAFLRTHIVFAGISAIEQALWEIKGKSLNVPVYEMVGGKIRNRVRVYANGWCGRSIEPSEFARRAERVVKDGYTALKCYSLATPVVDARGHGQLRHVTRRSIDRAAETLAVERVKAVRNAVGQKVDLMLDLSGGLTTDAIIRLGRKLEEQDILFPEKPVDPFAVDALKKQSEHVHIPIALGERIYTRYGFRRIAVFGMEIIQKSRTNARRFTCSTPDPVPQSPTSRRAVRSR